MSENTLHPGLEERARALRAEIKTVHHQAEAGELAGTALDEKCAELKDRAVALKAERDLAEQEPKQDTDLRDALKQLVDEVGIPPGTLSPASASSSTSRLSKAGLTPHTRWGSADWGREILKGRTAISGKALITPGEPLPVALPAPAVVEAAKPVLVLRQLLNTADAAGGGYRYLRQNVRTNRAAEVAPGGLKPTSLYGLEWVESRVKVIAHVSEPLDRFDLTDAPALAGFLDSEMRFGVEQALEDRILNGAGNGGIDGFLHLVTPPAGGPVVNVPDGILAVIGVLEDQGNTVDGMVMSSTDWVGLLTAKDNEERYLITGGPVDVASRRLWGRPVVVSPSMTPGSVLVGAFRESAALVVADAGAVVIDVNPYSGFTTNEVTWRAETRADLAVLRPSAFAVVDIGPGGTESMSTQSAAPASAPKAATTQKK